MENPAAPAPQSTALSGHSPDRLPGPMFAVWFPETASPLTTDTQEQTFADWFHQLRTLFPKSAITCLIPNALPQDTPDTTLNSPNHLLNFCELHNIATQANLNPVATLVSLAKKTPGQDLILLAAGTYLPTNLYKRFKSALKNRTAAVIPFGNTTGPTFYANKEITVEKLDQILDQAPTIRIDPINTLASPCIFFPAAALRSIGFDADFADTLADALKDYAQRADVAGFHIEVAPIYVGNTLLAAEDPPTIPSNDNSSPTNSTIHHWLDSARLASSSKPRILLVTHDWGGGTERHVRELSMQVAEHCEPLVMRPAAHHTICISWEKPGENCKVYFPAKTGWDDLIHWLQSIGISRIHFHHIHRLPSTILNLAHKLQVPFDVTLHDYWPICPQYHLTTATGHYCREPEPIGCNQCLAERPHAWGLTIEDWRKNFHQFLSSAARIFAPSQDTSRRIRHYLPNLTISINPPHEKPVTLKPATYNIALLGKLSRAKGLTIVTACAEDARRRNLPLTFHILGPTDEPLPQWPTLPLFVHGEYEEDYLGELLATIRPDVFFFPVQTPETYSYTLSTALAYSNQHQSGILASDLGAAIDRLINLPFAQRLPATTSASDWNSAILQLCHRLTEQTVCNTSSYPVAQV